MIYRGDGARGLLDYLSGREGALLLSTNLDGETPRAFARQMGEVRKLYFRENVAQPVAHITLRPAPGEDLSNEDWQDAAQLALERLGFDNSPYAAYLHDHGEGRHLHLATYRVNFEGRLVSDSNDRFKLMQVARELEQTYGLEVATPRREARLTRAEIERRLRDPGREAAQQVLRNAIDQAATKHETVRAFLTELHRLGLQPNLKVARKTGVPQGITFALPDGTTIKGSDLGKKYSLAGICNRHELRLDLKPEGPYLVASEISQREFASLERQSLAADLSVRYGSRRTLFWQLPPGEEVAFVDLIALRLPHRLLGYADELPAPPAAPPDLQSRARKVRLLLELAEAGPAIAPPLPLPEGLVPEAPEPARRPLAQADCAEACQRLSAALVGASELAPSDAAVLRAEYHEAMVTALGWGRPGAAEVRPYETLSPQRSLSAEIEGTVDPRKRLPLAGEDQEFRPIPEFRLYEDRSPGQGLAGVQERPPGVLERTLQAAWEYERDGSPETYFRWAGLQQALRVAEQLRPPTGEPLSDMSLRTGTVSLAKDLLAAQKRYEEEPSEPNRSNLLRTRWGYQSLASRLPSTKGPLAQDPGSLSGDFSRLQAAFSGAEAQQGEQALSAGGPHPSAMRPVEEARALRAKVLHLRARLQDTERRFLADPTNGLPRAAWTDALANLRETEARLVLIDRAALQQLEGRLHRSVAALRSYEESYFRSPSPVAARLWSHAERVYLRASLAYESAKLRAEAVARRPEVQAQEERRRQVVRGSRRLQDIAERELLGLGGKARNLARRAAVEAWAQTPVGRTLLVAAHPVRAAVAAVPGGRSAITAIGAAAEVGRRSLILYAELRAANDSFRSARLSRAHRRLDQGDFSNRSLATALVKDRVAVVAAHPISLPAAIREARTAEAVLFRTYRSFRRGKTSRHDLSRAGAQALAARAAVTERLHVALGLPSVRDFTAVLGQGQGRAVAAWMSALEKAGLSDRAIASAVVEAAPFALASGVAAVAIVTARQLLRHTLKHFLTQVKEVLREQSEGRR